MANRNSTPAYAAGKSFHTISPQAEVPSLVDGLVQHPLISASAQVRILRVVDETGSASLGDIITELNDHPDPVAAVLVLVRLTILQLELNGPIDDNTIVRRAGPDLESTLDIADTQRGKSVTATGGQNASSAADGFERLANSPWRANIVVGLGSNRRDFSRVDDLRRPGIYILLNTTSLYVGMGSDVGQRVACGQQPIEDIEKIVVITDANNNLVTEQASVAERILWSRTVSSREYKVVNGIPDGAATDPECYCYLDTFVADACLAMRNSGLLFTTGSPRSVLAGPRFEPGRSILQRPFNELPEGEILELVFNDGRVALASKRAEDDWILLRGSDVRPETVRSASATASYLRAAWLHAGILVPSHDGRSYTLTRDMPFRSAGAVTHFVTGSKGSGRGGWQPIDLAGGFDPETAGLIAA